MALTDLAAFAVWLSGFFDRVQAAVDRYKAQVDAVAPGVADQAYAELSAKLAAIRAEADPAKGAEIVVREVLDALTSGQSFIKHPPTDLAG